MTTRLTITWNYLKASYWFIPVLLQLAAISLASCTIFLDELNLPTPFSGWSWIYKGDAGGARSVLSTIAGSMITAGSVTFSITIVALTMTSSQYGPRLLRNFMRDTVNQVVLGTFIATFVYSLLVLRSVVGGEVSSFVPHLSVTTAFVLAFISALILIYYIHHISSSLSAGAVIASVSKELEHRIEKILPKHFNQEEEEPACDTGVAHLSCHSEGEPFYSRTSGYLQAIDYSGLKSLMEKKNGLLKLDHRAGNYLVAGVEIGRVWPAMVDRGCFEKLDKCLMVGVNRTAEQDLEFAIRQLVEIAVRALSPGINDPYTAIACVDHLGSAITKILNKETSPRFLYDSENTLRLEVDTITHSGCIDAAFNQIRQFSACVPAVALRLLETFAVISPNVRTKAAAQSLFRQVEGVYHASKLEMVNQGDLEDLERRYQTAKRRLELVLRDLSSS